MKKYLSDFTEFKNTYDIADKETNLSNAKIMLRISLNNLTNPKLKLNDEEIEMNEDNIIFANLVINFLKNKK